MLLFMMILIFIFCWFKPIAAELKLCPDPKQGKPELCLTGNGEYDPPFPVTVFVELFLGEIVEIDANRNSISLRLGLLTYWTDPKIGLTNDSIG